MLSSVYCYIQDDLVMRCCYITYRVSHHDKCIGMHIVLWKNVSLQAYCTLNATNSHTLLIGCTEQRTCWAYMVDSWHRTNKTHKYEWHENRVKDASYYSLDLWTFTGILSRVYPAWCSATLWLEEYTDMALYNDYRNQSYLGKENMTYLVSRFLVLRQAFRGFTNISWRQETHTNLRKTILLPWKLKRLF